MTPAAYVRTIRVNHARKLLAETDMTVAAIAAVTGAAPAIAANSAAARNDLCFIFIKNGNRALRWTGRCASIRPRNENPS